MPFFGTKNKKPEIAQDVRLTCVIPWITSTPPDHGNPLLGGVAQLVRALACHARGRGFKSRHSRHFPYFILYLERLNRRTDISFAGLTSSHGLTEFSKAG